MSELLKDGRTGHVSFSDIVGFNENKRKKIWNVKVWLSYIKPQFEFIPGEEGEKVKRLSDGEIFERMYFYYKYEQINGRQYYYDIMIFHRNMRLVTIRIYDESHCYVRSVSIRINNLQKPVKI